MTDPMKPPHLPWQGNNPNKWEEKLAKAKDGAASTSGRGAKPAGGSILRVSPPAPRAARLGGMGQTGS